MKIKSVKANPLFSLLNNTITAELKKKLEMTNPLFSNPLNKTNSKAIIPRIIKMTLFIFGFKI